MRKGPAQNERSFVSVRVAEERPKDQWYQKLRKRQTCLEC